MTEQRKVWEPKTSDCFLVTGGQMKRIRDAETKEERQEMIEHLRHQKYVSEIKKKEATAA